MKDVKSFILKDYKIKTKFPLCIQYKAQNLYNWAEVLRLNDDAF